MSYLERSFLSAIIPCPFQTSFLLYNSIKNLIDNSIERKSDPFLLMAKQSKPTQKHEITLDQFFKWGCEVYFKEKKFEVHTEKELITGPKRIDVILIKQPENASKEDFRIFTYFTEHNLISYKSFKDKFNEKAVSDCFIYYWLYLQTCREAYHHNTTITLITSKTSRKVLSVYKDYIVGETKGRVEIKYGHIHFVILHIEELTTEGEDGAFLSSFCKEIGDMPGTGKPDKSTKVIDTLKKVFHTRLYLFEGVEKHMGAVADITHLVQPKIEEAERRGMEKGKVEGKVEGKAEGKAEGKVERSQEVALGMLNKGYSVSDIRDITGLSEETIKDLKNSLS